MAPEYALWGYLSYKADVYSFGVVVLETVSGKSNNNYMPSDNCVCLLDKVFCYTSSYPRCVFVFCNLHILKFK
jgi:hypothetical protein